MCAITGHGAPQWSMVMGSQRMHQFLVGFGALVGNVAGAMGGFACAPWSASASGGFMHYALGGFCSFMKCHLTSTHGSGNATHDDISTVSLD